MRFDPSSSKRLLRNLHANVGTVPSKMGNAPDDRCGVST
jgi:hypothetical protein